ncbi:MAG: hypothetical protein H6980_00255 [Gammaproteobacteria bacterium]|nr:hypothetical protein [Gammaproteobacteria bacterium]
MTRRELLIAMAAGALGLTGPDAITWLRVNFVGPDLPAQLDAIRADLVKAGWLYLDKHPDEADLHRLRGQLPPTLNPADLHAAITTDFVLGHTDTLFGWVLSVTELRLCALVALSAEKL